MSTVLRASAVRRAVAASPANKRHARRLATVTLTVSLLAGTAAALAPSASAASYRCKTSTASVDNPAYSGPWADNINFTVKMCAKKSGGYIYTYARVDFEGPVMNVNMTDIFDGARFYLVTKKSVSGTDPTVKSAYYTGLEYRLEHGNTAGNGSYTTGTLKHKAASSGRYYADGSAQLDWNNDGKSYRSTGFSASPIV
ncbi:hypothetical protein ACFQ7N_39640 [Streptomyces niveus]|uniref:hypothetical protein n=1 Tax=Streptomyces niveus TaxID=193462 RepID=UPI0036A8D506